MSVSDFFVHDNRPNYLNIKQTRTHMKQYEEEFYSFIRTKTSKSNKVEKHKSSLFVFKTILELHVFVSL